MKIVINIIPFIFFSERKDGIAITSEEWRLFKWISFNCKKNKFYLKAHNKENHLGHIYQYITLLLGMKPNQHEYKVMGLAPYTSNYEIEKCYKIFDKILKVKGLNVVFDKKPKDLFYHFREKLINCRFDGIAGALQKFLEKKLETWFVTCSKKLPTEIFIFLAVSHKILKLHFIYLKTKKLKRFSFPQLLVIQRFHRSVLLWSSKSFKNEIHPINSSYLGSSLKTNEIKRMINKRKLNKKFIVKSKFSAREVALAISKGAIVGRCAGRNGIWFKIFGAIDPYCVIQDFQKT